MAMSSLISLSLRASLVLIGVGVFVAWNTIVGVRTGSVVVRGGGRYTRRKDPRSFWVSVSLGFTFSVAALLLGLFNLARMAVAR